MFSFLQLCSHALGRLFICLCLLGGRREVNGADDSFHVRQKLMQHTSMNIHTRKMTDMMIVAHMFLLLIRCA